MKANIGGIINMKNMTMKRKIGWIACGMAASWMLTGRATATNYDWINNAPGSWTNVDASSIWQGAPATYPVFGDNVKIATTASGAPSRLRRMTSTWTPAGAPAS